MEKISTAKMKRQVAARTKKRTIGMDLGDRSSRYCVLDENGDVIAEGSVATTKPAMEKVFGAMVGCRIAIETGCHSPWVSRQLQGFGHEVIVANPRNVRLIGESTRKDDRLDARNSGAFGPHRPKPFRPGATPRGRGSGPPGGPPGASRIGQGADAPGERCPWIDEGVRRAIA